MAQSLSQWQGHLLSCQVTAKERDLRILNPDFFPGQTRKNAQQKYSEGLIFWKYQNIPKNFEMYFKNPEKYWWEEHKKSGKIRKSRKDIPKSEKNSGEP